jgi:hypothetical protein
MVFLSMADNDFSHSRTGSVPAAVAKNLTFSVGVFMG